MARTKAKSRKSGIEPKALRPNMTGYGVPKSEDGMLPWDWAQERLGRSHNYWITTVRPDASPHTMVVWGVWIEGAWYFSTSAISRKSRNLEQNSRCIICNENAQEAVILEGVARRLRPSRIPPQASKVYKEKYSWDLNPNQGPVWQVRPKIVFAMPEKLFPKGVTKWVFE